MILINVFQPHYSNKESSASLEVSGLFDCLLSFYEKGGLI